MTKPFRTLTCLLLCAAASAAAEPITVSAAWVRATPPGVTTAAAYLTLANNGPANRLLAAQSPAARELQLHTTTSADGIKHMQHLADIALPAAAAVKLEPGGLHIMLFDIAAPLKPGDRVRMTLHFATGPDIELQVPVLDGRTLTEQR